jgi:type I restriction enzyme R subunit
MDMFNIISQRSEYAKIYEPCEQAATTTIPAERAKYSREALHEIIRYIYAKEEQSFPPEATLLELIDGPVVSEFVNNPVVLETLHYIRKLGMNAVHGLPIKRTQGEISLKDLVFFAQFLIAKYETPNKVSELVLPQFMSEMQTRSTYIDLYLNEAGWDVLSPKSSTVLPDGTEVKSGTLSPGKACCEIPVKNMPNKSGIGFCDYVLYGKNGKPLAIVEAKKTSVEALVGQEQVELYGECMCKEYGYVPVLYYTNGYEICVIDGIYPARRVVAFHSGEELEFMLQKRQRNDITDIKVNEDIAGRPYQKMAVTSICERFNAKQHRCLLVMATGTGKTRVAISIVDVLTRNKWARNILFLADRTSLVEQAFKNFSKLLPNMTYCVLSNTKLADDANARITLSTHQTMINYIDAENKAFTSGKFDLIIIDEAHRSVFNKYGAIFDYFDSLLIGLTATPKNEVDANTYELFNCENGEPNFAYSMEEAIREKYLVPYKVNNRTTELLSRGVKYKDLSEKDKRNVESVLETTEVEDEYVLPKEKLFKLFYNIDTCGRVIDDIMTNGIRIDGGQIIGKTIIFAYNHRHAEMIVNAFKRNYPNLGEDYCQLIDNKVKYADHLIVKFEENKDFRIAVSVDMLDTGVDIPEVLNLVFFKPIKSKIKFIQMIGRGTRLCPNLIDGKDKQYFLIFDYCGNFEYFGIHPENEDAVSNKSLTQKIFDLQLDILVELQSWEYQSNIVCKEYYDKLKPKLIEKVQQIKLSSTRIAVRKEMSYVDKYNDASRWNSISLLNKKEIQLHLSKLIDNDLDQDVSSLRFDIVMLQIEITFLASKGIGAVSSQVEKVRLTAKKLLEEAASQPCVMNKAETLKAVVGTEFWQQPSIDKLEQYREDIRELVKYIINGHKATDINTSDMVILKDAPIDNPLVDIRTYKEKVIDYLAGHTDNKVIAKIANLEPINAKDIKELEKLLWQELGTKEQYRETTDNDNLAAFIRSIVGIDQKALNAKFGRFLSSNNFNAQQQEFVKAIIDYVRENGDIQREDLLNTQPFASYDISSLFGDNTVLVAEMVSQLHDSITVARI